MSLLDLADEISCSTESDSSKQSTIRLVTFQSRDVTDALLNNGYVETTTNFINSNTPRKLSRIEPCVMFVKLDDGIIKFNESDKDSYYKIHKSSKHERVYPFYAYHKHAYCGELKHMSIYTIYRLASHFMGYMGFEGRDIIELEVPYDHVLMSRSTSSYEECLIDSLNKDWVVSILKFEDYVTEAINKELAMYYKNYVYREDTYRMCYGKDVVLNGHGRGDFVDCLMSPEIINNVTDSSIQRDYVQPGLYKEFACYVEMRRMDISIDEYRHINAHDALRYMPAKIDKDLISSFKRFLPNVMERYGVHIWKTDYTYKERVIASIKGYGWEEYDNSDIDEYLKIEDDILK